MCAQTNTNTQNRDERSEDISNAETVVGWAVFGCLVAGGVGIFKALNMESGKDVLLCLLGSAAAFGIVLYVYLRKS